MNHSLDESRRRLRRYLIPHGSEDSGDPAFDDDQFPRSKVMRFAVNPRNRQLVILAGSVLAVLATRAIGAGRFGIVADIARSFSGFRNNRS